MAETVDKHKEGPVVMETMAKPKGGPLTYCNGPPLAVYKGPLSAVHKVPPWSFTRIFPWSERMDKPKGGTFCDESTAKSKEDTL